ncbi:MAG TPA: hypothetical protein ENN73_06700 [Firmicutes bacterium]|nr:hypothetical protein [Bacillota bacterium]
MNNQTEPNPDFYPKRKEINSKKIFGKRGGFFTRIKSKIIHFIRQEYFYHILTIFIPGLGHFFLGEILRGLVFLILAAVSVYFSFRYWNTITFLFPSFILFTVHSTAFQDESSCFSRKYLGTNSINWRQVILFISIIFLLYFLVGRILGAQIVLWRRI